MYRLADRPKDKQSEIQLLSELPVLLKDSRSLTRIEDFTRDLTSCAATIKRYSSLCIVAFWRQF